MQCWVSGISGGTHARRAGSMAAAQPVRLPSLLSKAGLLPPALPGVLEPPPLPSAAPSIIPGRSSSWIFASL